MYAVYILTSESHKVLYIGVTSSLKKRVWEHREKIVEGFTKKYSVTKLVYYEVHEDIRVAIQREKCLKRWKREWKERIINERNPGWRELYFEI
ncbi:MAG: GIY-YIG nuclease family protein [bacterium]